MRMFASATTLTSGGCCALSAGRFELVARECEGPALVEVRALTDRCEERAEVVGAYRAIDVSPSLRCVSACGAQRRQRRKASIHSAPSGRGTGSGRSRSAIACV
jgi:hypothetical protein